MQFNRKRMDQLIPCLELGYTNKYNNEQNKLCVMWMIDVTMYALLMDISLTVVNT